MLGLKQTILNLVQRGGVSFVEIESLPGAQGDFGIDLVGRNVEVWRGLSEDAATAIAELRDVGLIHFRPCSPLVYVSAGCALNLPIAQSPHAYLRGYASPRWLPMTVEPGPLPKPRALSQHAPPGSA
jgi:hypothetical protein